MQTIQGRSQQEGGHAQKVGGETEECRKEDPTKTKRIIDKRNHISRFNKCRFTNK